MTLIKSLLLGSAAGLVAVASAQAADLPTHKGAVAAEYVKICHITVAGTPVVGFTLPGSDTCFKISGYITGHVEGGTLENEYTTISKASNIGTVARPDIGYSTRGMFVVDAVSNTAAGPLVGHIEFQGDAGAGFEALAPTRGNTGWDTVVLNNAYVQWAGITAGIHGSFYDFFAGGDTWKDFFSPDHSGTPAELLAYTAAVGGISATLSLETPEAQVAGTEDGLASGYTAEGIRSPDIVFALDAAQAWGKAHAAFVAHQSEILGPFGDVNSNWGFGVIGGLQLNIPGMTAGSTIGVQGAWTQGAIAWSGVESPGWQGPDPTGININGNGYVGFSPSDAIETAPGVWKQATAWTIAAQGQFKISPMFEIDPQLSYGSLAQGAAFVVDGPTGYAGWWVGAVWDFTPVTNLDFALDTIYQTGNFTGTGPLFTAPKDVDGLSVRLRITRSF